MSETPTPMTDCIRQTIAIGDFMYPGDGLKLALDHAEQLEREVDAANSENTRLRAALANSDGACVYCQLPKGQWATCRSGFPGCARADDAMGCPELGASMQLEAANERIRRLTAAGDAIVDNGTVSERLFQAWTKAKEANQ